MLKLVLDLVYLATEFEDYSFSHYKDMKEEPKYKNSGDLG